MKKGRTIFALVLNFLVLAAAGYGCARLAVGIVQAGELPKDLLNALVLLPVDMAIFAVASAIFSIIADIDALARKKNPAKFATVVKLMAAAAGVVVAAFTVGYLGFYKADATQYTDLNVNIWLNIAVPALLLISCIVENKPRLRWFASFWAILPTGLYVAAALVCHLIIHFSIPNFNPYGPKDHAGRISAA